MKYLQHIFSSACAVMLSMVLFSSCDKSDPVAVPYSNLPKLDATLSQTTELSLFNAALQKTDLTTFLTGPGDFTLLAPNNAAMNSIGINTVADLDAIPKVSLSNFLLYHIIPDRRNEANVPIGPNATLGSQNGVTLYCSKYGSNMFFNGVFAVTKDKQASNGVIHILNRPLVIPPGTPTVSLQGITQYKLFLQAITKTGTTANINVNPGTVFAPTNAALTAAGYDSTTIANLSGAALTTFTNIIKHHVIAGRYFSCDFQAKPYKTAQGTNITVDLSAGVAVKGAGNATAIPIVGADLATTTGVVHAINGVLKP